MNQTNKCQLIEIWETFLMQLDAEEDENIFYKPPVEPSARQSDERDSSETTGTGTVVGEDDN